MQLLQLRWTFSRKLIALMLGMSVAFAGMSAIGQAPAASAATKADKILALGKKFLGTPYKFGAPSGVTYAFDCSSFVQYIFGKYGVKLPRTSKAQATKGVYVSKANLKKGDLVFFSTASSGGAIGHVAVYAGNGKILHTYGKPGVTYSNLNSSYWKSHYKTARRVL